MITLTVQQQAAVGGGMLIKPPFWPPDPYPAGNPGFFEQQWQALLNSLDTTAFVRESQANQG